MLTKTEKCSLTKTDEFVGFTKPERQKNIRGTESYVKREFVQNRRSFHEGKAVMKPILKSTLGHNKTFQAVLFGEESTNGTFRLGFFNFTETLVNQTK